MTLSKILSTDAVTNRCEQVLQKKLSDKTLKLALVAHESDKSIFSITSGSGAINFTDEDIKHREVIVPFVQTPNQDLFWLGFSIVFKKVSKSHFGVFHIGLRIVQGQVSAVEKKKIFRAEWMIDKNNHAQPHWHIHKSYINGLDNKTGVAFAEEDEVFEFGAETANDSEPNKKDELKNFHFAMASRWHKKEPHNNDLTELNELVLWLEGCIDYIIEQLNYIA